MNTNDRVRAKLTETGKRLLVEHTDALNDELRQKGNKTFRFTVPQWEDDWIYDQLWKILSYFPADAWTMGCEAPFTELETIIDP